MPPSPETEPRFPDSGGNGSKEEKRNNEESSEGEQERLERYEKEYRELKSLGHLFLGASGFTIRVDPDAETFSFNAKTREVTVAPELVEGAELTPEEQTYVFTHEIGHIAQMAEDPDAYLGTFEDAKHKAEEWADAERAKVREQDGGGTVPPETEQRITQQEQQIRQAWGTYYNVFLDIHDNACVESGIPRFYGGDEEDHPRQRLYGKLFPRTDFTREPRHIQFTHAALRRVMRPQEQEEVQISDEVQEVLDEPFSYLGQQYDSLQQYIQQEFFNGRTSFSTLLFRMKRVVEQRFRALLDADAADGDLVQQSTGGMGDLDAGLPEEAAKEIAEGIKRADKSPEERASEEMERQFRQEAENAGFGEREIKQMQEIMENANDVFRNLVDLWGVFVQTATEPQWAMEEGFRTGRDISVDQFVKQLPTLLAEPDQAKLFERKMAQEGAEQFRPKKINLYLVPDLSDSMDNAKRQAVQEAVYALFKSLIQFRRNMAVKSEAGKSPVDINARVLGFGDSTEDLFKRTDDEKERRSLSDENPHDLDTRMWRSVLDIQARNLGGTEDAEALERIRDELSGDDIAQALTDNNEVAVAIEVTDGNTNTEDASGALVEELNNKANIFARGIKIPGALFADQPTKTEEGSHKAPEVTSDEGKFERVWGQNGMRLDDITYLQEVMTRILFQALQQTKE